MNDVAQKAAALTPEQKTKMKTLGKKYILIVAVYSAIAVIIILGLFIYFSSRYSELFSEYMAAPAGMKGASALLAQAQAARTSATVSMVVGLSVYVIGYVLIYILFKKKYPYYSDKLYRYMKKQGML